MLSWPPEKSFSSDIAWSDGRERKDEFKEKLNSLGDFKVSNSLGDFKPPMEEGMKDSGNKEVKWLKLIRKENLTSQDCLDWERLWEEV